MQDNPSASAARELRAAAHEMLRLSSQWAHTALNWVDDRRYGMGVAMDDSDIEGRERDAARRYRSGYPDHSDRAFQDRDARGHEGTIQARDRDVQGRYSSTSDGGSVEARSHDTRNDLGQGPDAQQQYGTSRGLPSQDPQPHGSQGPWQQAVQRGYRGLGPKTYSRSDERICEDLHERLTEADEIDARDITVEVNGGVVTLGGTVPRRWMKHRAEDLADSCSSVRDVHNQIRMQAHCSGTTSSVGAGLQGAHSGSFASTSGSTTPTSTAGTSTLPGSATTAGVSPGTAGGSGTDAASTAAKPGGTTRSRDIT